MKRIVHKAKGFADAKRWDIHQYKNMTTRERLRIANELKVRVYGEKTLDIREAERMK